MQIGRMSRSAVKDESRIGSRRLAGMEEYAESAVLSEEVQGEDILSQPNQQTIVKTRCSKRTCNTDVFDPAFVLEFS